MNMQGMLIIVIVSSIVVFGIFGFANDLSQSTSLTYSENLKNETSGVMNSVQQLSGNITSTVQGSSSWLETGFTLMFRLPSILGNLFKIPGIMITMGTTMMNELGVPVPNWIPSVLIVIIGVIVIFSILALIFKWRV